MRTSVRITQHGPDRFTAYAPAFAEAVGHGATRDDAVAALQRAVDTIIATSTVVDINLDADSDPWQRVIGMFADDPNWDAFQAAMSNDRAAIDAGAAADPTDDAALQNDLRSAIMTVLDEFKDYARPGETAVILTNADLDHYQLLYFGWHNRQHRFRPVIHLQIVDQQIIIESNGGPVDVVPALVELGVPRRSIVFGWFRTSIADEPEGGGDANKFGDDFFERVPLDSERHP